MQLLIHTEIKEVYNTEVWHDYKRNVRSVFYAYHRLIQTS